MVAAHHELFFLPWDGAIFSGDNSTAVLVRGRAPWYAHSHYVNCDQWGKGLAQAGFAQPTPVLDRSKCKGVGF